MLSDYRERRPRQGAAPEGRGQAAMDYEGRFAAAIFELKREDRYRIFANLERDAARFPQALWRPEGEEHAPRDVTVWCSNDYLGMGGHEAVIEAGVRAT